MTILKVPKPLQTVLGDEGTEGLLEMLEQQQNQTKDATIETAADRFERRLTEESARLDNRITEETARLRVDIAGVEAKLDNRITEETAKLRVEIAEVEAKLETRFAELKTEVHKSKSETIRWMFIFYISQVGALGGLLYALLR